MFICLAPSVRNRWHDRSQTKLYVTLFSFSLHVQLTSKTSHLLRCIILLMSIPIAALSKTWVCGRYFAGVPGSNPAGGMDASLCCLLSGRVLCDGPITLTESYRVWCFALGVIAEPPQWGGLGPLWAVEPRRNILLVTCA